MRVIICGGRSYRMDALDWCRLDALHAADPSHLGCHGAPLGPITAVYQGDALGADHGGKMWAISRGIPWVPFPADWNGLGPVAGPLRNLAMLQGGSPSATGPAELVVAFPGGTGTADMVGKAHTYDVPVLDLRAPRAQRWSIEEASDLSSFANYFILGDGGRRSVDASRRAALRTCQLAHGGLGVPCCSAYAFRQPGRDEILLPPGALYVGRPGMIGLKNVRLPEDGDGSILGNPVAYKGGLDAEHADLALERYRGHLRDIYKSDPRVPALLDRIAHGGTLLVCWCHASKPCHATVIAEAALLARAVRETRAAGLQTPPRDLLVSSARSTASGRSASREHSRPLFETGATS